MTRSYFGSKRTFSDLFLFNKDADVVNYDNDSILYISGENSEGVSSNLESPAFKLVLWRRNEGKFKYMHILSYIDIDSKNFCQQLPFRKLTVTENYWYDKDKKLNFHEHASDMLNKISTKFSALSLVLSYSLYASQKKESIYQLSHIKLTGVSITDAELQGRNVRRTSLYDCMV